MDPDLSERYNDGIVPPPALAGQPSRIEHPAWMPTPAQVEAARKQLGRSITILALLVFSGLVIFALLSGWRP